MLQGMQHAPAQSLLQTLLVWLQSNLQHFPMRFLVFSHPVHVPLELPEEQTLLTNPVKQCVFSVMLALLSEV